MESDVFNCDSFLTDKIDREVNVLIKPHHFLDYLYDLGIDYRHDDEINVNGNNNAELCRAFFDGKIKKIKFTPFVDDICRPCKKLVDGKRCSDFFDDETTLFYGFRYKNDFNYQLDLKLNEALPQIFCFDKIWNTFEVLCELEKDLTGDIIELYKWERRDRVKNTLIGIKKAMNIYK
ncbi:MAG: hypothetical protein J6T42_03040 [Clostridia bacterium]|nr:hypothetical protein [Clostridia bacterium]